MGAQMFSSVLREMTSLLLYTLADILSQFSLS